MMKKSTRLSILIAFIITCYTSCQKPDQDSPGQVDLNTAPVVDAGKDRIVLYPDDSTILNGTFIDNDTASTTFLWTSLRDNINNTYWYFADIENPTQLVTKVSFRSSGKYQFQLKVTDRNGLIGIDTVEINHIFYAVSAGGFQVIALPTRKGRLLGSTVLSPDSVLKKEWKKISGPNVTIVSPNELTSEIIDLEEGSYIFELSVTDKANITRKAQCSVSVIEPGGPHVWSEPLYSMIYLPIDFTTLKGNISSNQYTQSPVTKISWMQVTGPSGLSIETPMNKDTKISGLREGVYEIRCEATDATGATTSRMITVAVVDSLSPDKEVVVQGVSWYGEGGFDCAHTEVKLDSHIPAGKPIKKVFIKCGSDWIEAEPWYPSYPVYLYRVESRKLFIDWCNDGCNNYGSIPEIRIVY